MLAMYSSLIKKEEILNRVSQDAEELAAIANDLVCELKIISASSKNKNLESSMNAVSNAEELVNQVKAMVMNIKVNLNGYTNSLIQVSQVEQKEEVRNQNSETVVSKEETTIPSSAEPVQMNSILDAIKTLKEMRDNLPK